MNKQLTTSKKPLKWVKCQHVCAIFQLHVTKFEIYDGNFLTYYTVIQPMIMTNCSHYMLKAKMLISQLWRWSNGFPFLHFSAKLGNELPVSRTQTGARALCFQDFDEEPNTTQVGGGVRDFMSHPLAWPMAYQKNQERKWFLMVLVAARCCSELLESNNLK